MHTHLLGSPDHSKVCAIEIARPLQPSAIRRVLVSFSEPGGSQGRGWGLLGSTVPYQTKALEKVKSVPMVSMMSLPRVTLDKLRQAATKSSTRLSTLCSSRAGSSLKGSSGVPQSQLKPGGGP